MSEREPWVEPFREQLHGHEEPYQLGAWEQFEKHRGLRQRQQLWRRILATAAAVVIGIGLYWMVGVVTDSPVELAQREGQARMQSRPPESPSSVLEDSGLPQGSSDHIPDEVDLQELNPGSGDQSRSGESVASTSRMSETNETPVGSDDAVAEVVTDEASAPWVLSPLTSQVLGVSFASLAPSDPSTNSVRMQELSSPLAGGRESWRSVDESVYEEEFAESNAVRVGDLRFGPRDQEFAWGVAYAPVMNIQGGTTQMSMGAGVHARMELRNGWGLGSALVLSRNRFQTDADAASFSPTIAQTAMASGGPTVLESRMEADLVSLEVPLHVRYDVSDTVTLTSGFSTIAYLQETYTYRVDYRQPYYAVRQSEEGIRFESGERERTEQVREQEAPMSGLYWGAFYNMGAEFSWLISNRHWVSVEPFFKIPTGDIAKQNLTYSSGGVQLKLYF